MSTVTRACAVRREDGRVVGWSSAAGSAPRAARSSKASTSPTPRRGCRREFEEKGLYVLGIQRAGGVALGRLRLPTRARVSRPASSWSSTRSSRRCSRRACRWCSRSTSCGSGSRNPLFKSVLDDVYERVRAGSSLSEAFEAHGTLFPGRLHGVAAGRREERQPRAGHPPLRRLREGRRRAVKRKTISALVYPAILLVLSLRRRRDHRAAGRAGVRRVLRAVRRGAAALDADHRRGLGFRARRTSC